jgi:exodeoxyribonuclease V gamma subunit
VPGVCGDVLGTVTFSRLSARHRVAAWVRLLALTAAYPERAFAAVTVGRARSGAPDGTSATIARIPPVSSDVALGHLATLVDLWDRGMREPLPIACLSSAAYAHAAAAGVNAVAAGRRAWESSWNRAREDVELEHQLVLGGVLTFAELLDEPPRDDEAGEGWDAAETTRFGRLARRLWDGPLACEEVADQ